MFTGLICYFYHPVRVWLADGKWCTQFYPDGTEKIFYSEECSGFAPHPDLQHLGESRIHFIESHPVSLGGLFCLRMNAINRLMNSEPPISLMTIKAWLILAFMLGLVTW